jgi:hypothetical protein
MHEQVIATVCGRDEAMAFFATEPFDRALTCRSGQRAQGAAHASRSHNTTQNVKHTSSFVVCAALSATAVPSNVRTDYILWLSTATLVPTYTCPPLTEATISGTGVNLHPHSSFSAIVLVRLVEINQRSLCKSVELEKRKASNSFEFLEKASP